MAMRNDKRQQIMKAAERLFANRRFHELTLDMVAEAAKVGKGTIYRYFRDKDDLFYQTATSGFENMCRLLEADTAKQGDFRSRLLDACIKVTDFFAHHRQLFRIMQDEEGRIIWSNSKLRERWMAEREKLVAAVAGILKEGAEGGHIRTDVPADVLAVYLLGMLRTRSFDLPAVSPDSMRLEILLDVFTTGASASVFTGDNDKGMNL
jgi:AcrR family transcriptional regulator